MRTGLICALIAAAFFLIADLTFGAGNVAGYKRVVVKAYSDTVVAMPFNNGQEAGYTVAGKNGATVTVSAATLPANTFDGTYYIRILDGQAEGLWSTIDVQDTADEVDLADSDILADVSAGDTFGVYLHRTIGAVFTEAMQDVLWNSETHILLPINSAAGINKGYIVVGWNSTEKKWKAGIADYTSKVINPEQAFIIRNLAETDLTWIAHGEVANGKVGRYLPGNGEQDILIGPLPRDVALKDLNLEGEGHILLPPNDVAGYNKGYTIIGWNETEQKWKAGIVDKSDTVIPGGEGFLLRRTDDNITKSKWTVE